jgi:hypothetical protein
VREEIEHVRQGKHGARSAKQVIAIGLSKAGRAGVKLPPPPGQKAPQATGRKSNPKRSRAALRALEGEGTWRHPIWRFRAKRTAARGSGAAQVYRRLPERPHARRGAVAALR